MAAYFLTDADTAVLKELVRWYRNRRPGPDQSPEDFTGPAQSIYIAKPQDSGGLPALTAGTGGDPDVAGSAECDIYHIAYNGTDPALEVIYGFTKTVLNLSSSVIPQGFVVVVRTAGGNWVAIPPLRIAVHCKGVTTGAVAKTDSTFTVDTVLAVAYGDTAPGNGSTDTFIISNWAKWESKISKRCDFIITDLTPASGSIGHGDFLQGACKADQ